MDAESTGSFGDASLKHSWVTGWFQAEVLERENSYWLLISAGSLRWKPGGANPHWLMAQAGSSGQPRGMLHFHWSRRPAASPYADEAASVLEACERHPRAAYFLKVQEQERSGHQGSGLEEAWGQRPS